MQSHWVDGGGRKWRVVKAGKRLNFWNAGARALRAFVYARDGFMCVRCGWTPPSVPANYDGTYTLIGPDVNGKRRELQLDHVIPIYSGGENHPDNMQTLCFGCNAGKGAR